MQNRPQQNRAPREHLCRPCTKTRSHPSTPLTDQTDRLDVERLRPHPLLVHLSHHEHCTAVDGPEVLATDAEWGRIRLVDVHDEPSSLKMARLIDLDQGINEVLFVLKRPDPLNRTPVLMYSVETVLGHENGEERGNKISEMSPQDWSLIGRILPPLVS